MNENGQLVKGGGEMDARGLVTGATNAVGGTAISAYAYDSAGNVTLASRNAETNLYTANARNHSVAVAGASPSLPSYDADGNLSAFDGFSLWWDASGRLLSAVSGEGETQYEYDWLGRRTTAWNGGDTVRDFVWDGWLPVDEHLRDAWTGEDLSVTRYIWGADLSGSPQGAGGIGGLLAVERGSVWYAPLYDGCGNVTAYVSETGELVAEYEYDAFGNTISQSGALADAFPFRFSTKYFDAEIGFYYYGLRHYSPKLRRWISEDPAGENAGANLYAFCANDPVNGVDPLGLFKVYAVSNSPRYSSNSDFWFSVAYDFEDDDFSSGYVWITQKRSVNLYECNSKKKYNGINSFERKMSTRILEKIPHGRSPDEQVLFDFTDGKKRGYVEVFSEGKLKNVCGEVHYDIHVEYKKTPPNITGIAYRDKHKLKWYDNLKSGKEVLNDNLSATYHAVLRYSCNDTFSPRLEAEQLSGVWKPRTPEMIDRIGEQGNRRGSEGGSFPYVGL